MSHSWNRIRDIKWIAAIYCYLNSSLLPFLSLSKISIHPQCKKPADEKGDWLKKISDYLAPFFVGCDWANLFKVKTEDLLFWKHVCVDTYREQMLICGAARWTHSLPAPLHSNLANSEWFRRKVADSSRSCRTFSDNKTRLHYCCKLSG